MFVVASYAIGVFVIRALSIWLRRSRIPALLIVASWAFLRPGGMQVLNQFHVGYVDPFWKWGAAIQCAIALVSPIAGAHGVRRDRTPGRSGVNAPSL
ncbi:MAG TPA: hypothetical protein VJP84_17765 [Steroidobacteraceae bacterium]|nr:hypothetical protein [Steroidobacteraceae bacterium]